MFQNIPSPAPSLMPERALPGISPGKVGEDFLTPGLSQMLGVGSLLVMDLGRSPPLALSSTGGDCPLQAQLSYLAAVCCQGGYSASLSSPWQPG